MAEKTLNELLVTDTSAMNMNEKLDAVLKFNCNIARCMQSLKVDLNHKFEEFSKSMGERVEKVENDMIMVKAQCNETLTLKSTANSNSNEINALKERVNELEEEAKKRKVEELKNAVHARRYNLVIGNLSDRRAWESRETSLKLVREFLHSINEPINDRDTDIWNPDDVIIKEAHRLPQNPDSYFKSSSQKPGDTENIADNRVMAKSFNRRMVVKFDNLMDIRIILKKCCNLKTINNGKPKFEKLYVERHLPKELQAQRVNLRPEFNRLKREGKKPKFEFDFSEGKMMIIEEPKKRYA